MYVTPMATLYFGSKVEKAIRDLGFISFSYSKKPCLARAVICQKVAKKIKSHNFCTYYMLKICKWTNIDTLCLLNMTKSIFVVVKCSYLIFCWYNITLHNYSPCPVSRDHCGMYIYKHVTFQNLIHLHLSVHKIYYIYCMQVAWNFEPAK